MGYAIIRFLKICSYIVWMITTLIGTVMFYNLAGIEWEPHVTTYSDSVVVDVAIVYKGFFFDLNFTIEVRLYDKYNHTLASGIGSKVLKPGESKSVMLVIWVNTTKVDHGIVDIRVYQLKWGMELIGMDFSYVV